MLVLNPSGALCSAPDASGPSGAAGASPSSASCSTLRLALALLMWPPSTVVARFVQRLAELWPMWPSLATALAGCGPFTVTRMGTWSDWASAAQCDSRCGGPAPILCAVALCRHALGRSQAKLASAEDDPIGTKAPTARALSDSVLPLPSGGRGVARGWVAPRV